MRVADLGCGRTGHFVFPASRIVGAQGVVYAVEVVQNILESIKSRVRSEGYDNVQPIWADIELVGKVPVPNNSLDSCFMVNVLSILHDKTSALLEAIRILKADGFLVVVEWQKKLGGIGPADSARITPDALQTITADLPLRLIDIFSVGEYHYCALFKKVAS